MNTSSAIYPAAGGSTASGSSGAYRDKLLDLNTSNREILDIVDKVFSGGESNTAEQSLVTTLLSMRSQLANALSNAIRTILDGAAAIIRNMRA